MSKRFMKRIVCALFFFLSCTAPALTGTVQYTYDTLDRLIRVQFDDGATIDYAYDAAGNRLVKQVTAVGGPMAPGGQGSPPLPEAQGEPNPTPPPGAE